MNSTCVLALCELNVCPYMTVCVCRYFVRLLDVCIVICFLSYLHVVNVPHPSIVVLYFYIRNATVVMHDQPLRQQGDFLALSYQKFS